MTVGDLLDTVVPRLVNPPAMTLAEAVNTTAAHIFRRLVRRQSDIVMATTTATLTAGNNSFALPSGARGIVREAAVVEENGNATFRRLRCLEDPLDTSAFLAGTTGSASCYRLNNGTVEVYPVPAVDCKVKLWYWGHPTAVSLLTDSVPFSGLFDDLFREAIPRVLGLGGLALNADAPLVALLNEGVDSIAAQRQGRSIGFYTVPTGVQGGSW